MAKKIIEDLKRYIMAELERKMRWKEEHWTKAQDKNNPEREQDKQMFYHYQGEKFALIDIYEFIARHESEEK